MIHYHVDTTDIFDKVDRSWIEENEDWILAELDTWEYKGHYNSRMIGRCHNWVRLNSQFNTFEFRIGEMSFDYEVLAKRIIHANKIIRRVKGSFSSIGRLKALQEKLGDLNKTDEVQAEVDIQSIIKSRIIKG